MFPIHFSRKETQMENKNWDIYCIKYDGEVVYVGMTSLGRHRWTCHKTKARNANQHSRAIHDFMRMCTSDPNTFPEFEFEVICTTNDEDTAIELERYFQCRYDLPAQQKKSIRPYFEEYTTR